MSTLARVLVALTFLLFVMALGYYVALDNASDDYERLRRSSDELREGNLELEARNNELKREIHQQRTDSRVVEKRVRESLGLARRDEIVILLNQEPKTGVRHVDGR